MRIKIATIVGLSLLALATPARADIHSLALHRAELAGEPNPTITVSKTAGVGGTQTVTMTGHFKLPGATPHGYTPPTGTTLKLAFRGETVEDLKLTGKWTPEATATASSWGVCSYWHHCYAFAEWDMSGNEKVSGSEVQLNTSAMFVPSWQGDEFAEDEEWVGFTNNNNWTEVGQQSGEHMDCCTLHPFYAVKGNWGYYEHVGAAESVPPNTYIHYQMKWAGSSTWCIYWWGTQVGCFGGVGGYSTNLQVGMEVAADTKPSNAAKDAVDYFGAYGGTGLWWKESWSADRGLCIQRNGDAPAKGNIAFGTC